MEWKGLCGLGLEIEDCRGNDGVWRATTALCAPRHAWCEPVSDAERTTRSKQRVVARGRCHLPRWSVGYADPMENGEEQPRRLAFVEDDWPVIEWTARVLAIAEVRKDVEPEHRDLLRAMRSAVLALPFVGESLFDFSVTRPDDAGQPSFCIELSADAFTLCRVEHLSSFGLPETVATDDLVVMSGHRIGHQAESMREFFTIMWYAIESGSGSIAIGGEGGSQKEARDLDLARNAWALAFRA